MALCLALLVLLAEPAAANNRDNVKISQSMLTQLVVTKELRFADGSRITKQDLADKDVEFKFSACKLPDDRESQEKYQIGEMIQGRKIVQGRILGDEFFANGNSYNTQIINPNDYSSMPQKEKIDFATVSFNPNKVENRYFEVNTNLERYLAEGSLSDSQADIIPENDALFDEALVKYWGKMQSSTHLQTWIIRQPVEGDFATEEEKAQSQANGWPEDTVFYKIEGEPEDVWHPTPERLQGGQFEEFVNLTRPYQSKVTGDDGVEVEYPFFRGTEVFHLHANPGVTYSAGLLDRFPLRKFETYADGSLKSIAKPIATRTELRNFAWKVGEDGDYRLFHEMDKFYKDAYFVPVGTNLKGLIKRFLLEEEKNPELEKALGKTIEYSEPKILDVSELGILVFDNAEAAADYYEAAFQELESLGTCDRIQPVTFVNTVKGTPTPPSPKPQTKTIEGQKSWKDDKEEDRPKEITVKLLNGEGKEVQKTTTTAEKGWKYVFKDLPVKDAKGQTISYKVEEVVPEGYTASYEAFNITNSKKPTEEASSSEPPVPGGDSSEPLIPGGSISDSPFPGGDFSSEVYPGTSSVTEVSSEEEVSEIRQVVKKKPSKTGWFFPTPPTGDAGKTLPLIVLAAAVVALVLVSKKSRKSN